MNFDFRITGYSPFFCKILLERGCNDKKKSIILLNEQPVNVLPYYDGFLAISP